MFCMNALRCSAIMVVSLDHQALSVERFSRWLHMICTILLARNTVADRTKAMGTSNKPSS
ncbi:uncharacterized protein LACBIDRAFT_318202 [Laccaria bicolor S238N-H82]|uniref:Predicted protein n=1 Tax=Laccaria bicolor (strain S238N-H82 / ATCC MYA-4686) TaxID=486041 RepID=B0D673_LACBS|nr:uncharacterized protein LACBIDRAFT_318202 [Laccaria bicolor S238N-H82]EDR10148.1 predicted protein [Laccaria bicolor S238N-H82]|eukprot:XP_001879533.1 predicted protein [Laccaria bicolor S238N-H82]